MLDAKPGLSLVVSGLCLLAIAGWAPAQLMESPTFDTAVLQGGFSFKDPDDPERVDAGVLSLGPLVAAGVRDRRVVPGAGADVCAEALVLLIGARGTGRKPDEVTLRQSDHAVVFFSLFRCVGDDDVCVAGTSAPVAVAGCAGTAKVVKRRGVVGRARVRCRGGIDAADPAFALSTEDRGVVEQAFPDIGRKVQWRFRDGDAEEASGADLDRKLRNLDVHALENIVGTYLDDAELPACGP